MKEKATQLYCPVCGYGYAGVAFIREDVDEGGAFVNDDDLITLNFTVGSVCGNMAGKPVGASPCEGRLVKKEKKHG